MTVTTLPFPPADSANRLNLLLQLRKFLNDEIADERKKIMSSPEWTWLEAAADLYSVTPPAILSRDRGPSAVKARQIAAWLMRQDGLSFPAIGRAINRDHTTAIHACRTVENTPALRSLARQLWDQQKGAA